ncbi:MAG: prolipoprotein diacylglyceryl transferase [Betaproteobacteria bacterium AqS2]|uniref:Phosphatidylglycerol--prolipoprotein diacylglyceryl transferase n=1 Tax=Candidatus Amphirhobacter heronislandensis TaxID=1732024 RepID=A0A930UE48_9GAMM|nr:prolipoprotein diacylglyceryl transferase [Betaproteobacteria bacterium AqS2]
MTVSFDPVAASFFGFAIHWYGVLWFAAALQFMAVTSRFAPRLLRDPRSRRVHDNILAAALLGSLVGGRLGYALIYGWDVLRADPLWLFAIWEGGMSFHGGVAGMALACWLLARFAGEPVLRLADLFAVGAPLGLALGRFGNFINGELWGRPTGLPWGMVFPAAGDGLARHPSQLYELLAEGPLLFALLLAVVFWRGARPGHVAAAFLAGYAVIRFWVEFLREPDAHMGLYAGLSAGQLLSLPLLAAAAAVLYAGRRAA